MPENDNVVFLKFSSAEAQADSIVLSACKNCRNKTFTVLHDGAESFPMMRCAACGQQMGRIGWAE